MTIKEAWEKHSAHGFFSYEEEAELIKLAEKAEAEVERLRENIKKDSGPTEWAYQQVCKARDKWQKRAETLEAELLAVQKRSTNAKIAWVEASDRADKAEAELAKWMQAHDAVELQVPREQASNSHSLGASLVLSLEQALRDVKKSKHDVLDYDMEPEGDFEEGGE